MPKWSKVWSKGAGKNGTPRSRHDPHSIDRLARNLRDLLAILIGLKEKGVIVKFHKEKLEFVGKGMDSKTDAFQELQLNGR